MALPDPIYTQSTSLTLCDLIVKICYEGLPVLLTVYCAETGEELFSGHLNRRGLINLTFTDCYAYLYDQVVSSEFTVHGHTNMLKVKINHVRGVNNEIDLSGIQQAD